MGVVAKGIKQGMREKDNVVDETNEKEGDGSVVGPRGADANSEKIE